MGGWVDGWQEWTGERTKEEHDGRRVHEVADGQESRMISPFKKRKVFSKEQHFSISQLFPPGIYYSFVNTDNTWGGHLLIHCTGKLSFKNSNIG